MSGWQLISEWFGEWKQIGKEQAVVAGSQQLLTDYLLMPVIADRLQAQ